MNRQFILLLDGMTGAGKTTTSKFLGSKLLRTAIIGMDKVKRFVSDFERGELDNGIARDVVFTMAGRYLELGLSVIIDQPFKTIEEINSYEDLAKKHSIECFKFQLFTSPDIAHSRVTDRQKDYDDKVSDERIQRNISLFQKREDFGFVAIDTSDLKENEASKIILEKISS